MNFYFRQIRDEISGYQQIKSLRKKNVLIVGNILADSGEYECSSNAIGS